MPASVPRLISNNPKYAYDAARGAQSDRDADWVQTIIVFALESDKSYSVLASYRIHEDVLKLPYVLMFHRHQVTDEWIEEINPSFAREISKLTSDLNN